MSWPSFSWLSWWAINGSNKLDEGWGVWPGMNSHPDPWGEDRWRFWYQLAVSFIRHRGPTFACLPCCMFLSTPSPNTLRRQVDVKYQTQSWGPEPEKQLELPNLEPTSIGTRYEIQHQHLVESQSRVYKYQSSKWFHMLSTCFCSWKISKSRRLVRRFHSESYK